MSNTNVLILPYGPTSTVLATLKYLVYVWRNKKYWSPKRILPEKMVRKTVYMAEILLKDIGLKQQRKRKKYETEKK